MKNHVSLFTFFFFVYRFGIYTFNSHLFTQVKHVHCLLLADENKTPPHVTKIKTKTTEIPQKTQTTIYCNTPQDHLTQI